MPSIFHGSVLVESSCEELLAVLAAPALAAADDEQPLLLCCSPNLQTSSLSPHTRPQADGDAAAAAQPRERVVVEQLAEPNVVANTTIACVDFGDTVVNNTLILDSQVTGNYTFEWYADGVLIPGETDETLVVSQTGDYRRFPRNCR